MSISESTRNAVYHTLERLPESRARVLLEIVNHGPQTSASIARNLGWTVNRVTGRVFELRQAGLITEAGFEVSEFGKRCVLWKAAPAVVADTEGQFALTL